MLLYSRLPPWVNSRRAQVLLYFRMPLMPLTTNMDTEKRPLLLKYGSESLGQKLRKSPFVLGNMCPLSLERVKVQTGTQHT